jgi:hypothetical protein
MKPFRLFFAALLLALFSSVAIAQTTAPPTPTLDCEPKPVGTGTYSHVESMPGVGTWSVHFCPGEWDYKAQFLLKRSGYELTWPDMTGKTVGQIYRAAWQANVTLHPTDITLRDLYTPALAWAIENKPARWIINPISPATTRPLYLRTSATTVGAATGATAGAGLHCDCTDAATRVVTSTKTTYCPVASGQPADRIEVAVCSKVSP